MHQPRRVRGILTQPISLIRAFLLCLLLASSQLPALTGFFSIAEAAGHAHGGAIHPHIVHALNNSHVVSKLARPDVVTSAKHGHSHHSAADSLHRTVHPHLLKGHGLHAAMGPDLSVSLTGSSSLTLGAPATFTFSATNVAAASTASDTSTQPLLALSTPLIATIALPVGFTNVTATAADPTQWNVIANGTLVTATYTGSQPIQTGQVLPAITVTGTPTASLLNLPRNLQAVTGTIVAPGDVNLGNNTASVPLNVAQPVAVAATADPAVTANSVASTSPTVTANSAASTNSTTRSTSASAPGSVDVTLDNVMLNSANLSVGRPVTYNLTVSAASDSATINSGTPITVEDVVPLGLSNIVASASSGWSFAVSNTTSPSNVVATYNGAYPITPGSVLPIITIMGTLDSNVAAPFTNTANVLVANNSNRGMSSFSINVPGVAPAVSAPAVSTPAVSTPAVSTPAVSASAVSTPAVSAPAVSASAVSTPAVSAPAVSAPVVGMTNAPLANTDVTAVSDPTIIVVSPTVAGSSTSAPTTPALSLTKVSTGMSSTYSVGDRITYMLTAQDLATGADESQPITVQDIVPAGLTNITVTGRNWSVNEPASTSPVILSATYTGAYPVAAGTSLPPIIVSGVLTQEAATAGSFSTTADVSSSDDPGSALTAAVDTISMQAAPQASGDSSSPSPSVNATTIVTAANTVNATTTVTAADTVNATTTVTAADTVNDAAPVNGVATVNAAAPVNGAAPMNGPDLSVVKTSVNGDHYHVGDTVTFVLVVSNAPGAGTIADPSTISLEDVLPLGLKNIHVHGKLWNVISSGSASPTIIDANFTGLAPVTGGAVLPALIITGELIDDATPSFTSTAYVDVPNDANTNDKIASYTVFVHKHHNNNNDNNNNDNNNNDNNNNDNNNNHNNHNNHNNNNNNNNNNNFHTRVGVGTRVGIVIRRRSCVVTCGFPGLPGTGSDPFDDR